MRSTLCNCVVCKTTSKIIRRNNLRPIGHRKHMYCWKCKRVTLHIESYGQPTMKYKKANKNNKNFIGNESKDKITTDLIKEWCI